MTSESVPPPSPKPGIDYPEPRPIPGQIQLVIYVYVEGKGYLATRRGITMCGLTPEQAKRQAHSDLDLFLIEAKAGYRAITNRLKKLDAEGG